MKALKVIAITAVAIGLLVVASQYPLPHMCGNSVLGEYPSPDRMKRIVVFQRDCGATTGFSTQASVLGVDDDISNEPGNVFVADTNHGAARSGPGGGPELHVVWKSRSVVEFSYHENARVFVATSTLDGVTISHLKTIDAAQQSVAADRRDNAAPAER